MIKCCYRSYQGGFVMKAKLRLKYVGRFRNSYNIEEEQPEETKVDDKEYTKDKEEEKNS